METRSKDVKNEIKKVKNRNRRKSWKLELELEIEKALKELKNNKTWVILGLSVAVMIG